MRRRPGFAIGVARSNGSPDACASSWRIVDPSGPAAESRSTTPSSAATSVASATAGFVTDDQRSSLSRGPCVVITSPPRRTPAAATLAPQPSICRRAYTRRDTSRVVDRRQISSGSAWEERFGYSRAVVVGEHVHVGGTAPQMPGDADPPQGAYEQARRCL